MFCFFFLIKFLCALLFTKLRYWNKNREFYRSIYDVYKYFPLPKRTTGSPVVTNGALVVTTEVGTTTK